MTFEEAKRLKDQIGEKHLEGKDEYDVLVVPSKESERQKYFTYERSFETTDASALKYASDFEVNAILWMDNDVIFIRNLKPNKSQP